MDRASLHLETRNALSVADELSRHEHYLGEDELAARLAALRTALADLEREIGRTYDDESRAQPETIEAFERSFESLLVHKGEIPRALRARAKKLLASAERVSIALWDPHAQVPSKPLFGVLPIARVVPQGVHSLLDVARSFGFLASAAVARTQRATAVGVTLGLGLAGTSLTTDDRLGAVKMIPIEMHEGVDWAGSLGAIAAPFVLGYTKRDPLAALMHIGLGIGGLLVSLVTDYRAHDGISWPRRSKGGPRLTLPRGKRGGRVGDVQRPLEGFSAAPTDWQEELAEGPHEGLTESPDTIGG
jgi:hypothetical protein